MTEMYYVIINDKVHYCGTFKACVSYCRNNNWTLENADTIVITKVVADGKEV